MVTYEEFLEKFKPKKTTDDCYTVPEVYKIVRAWCVERYGVDDNSIVRPFWPGADYTQVDYTGKTVVDNPPFSLFSQITEYFIERDIGFFLFAPSLTLFSSSRHMMRCTHVCTGNYLTYANGAKVNTSFVTNLDNPDCIAKSEPILCKRIAEADLKARQARQQKKEVYEYPDEVIFSYDLGRFSRHDVQLDIMREDCILIRQLDHQSDSQRCFGRALMLSKEATAARTRAEEKYKAYIANKKSEGLKLTLSARERSIVDTMRERKRDEKTQMLLF